MIMNLSAVRGRGIHYHMLDCQEELARDLFDRVDWQHPDTLLEEDFINGEYDYCLECGRTFACYDEIECLHCHEPYYPGSTQQF